MNKINVEDLMTKEVGACHAEDTMDEAARIFWEHDCGCVPIVDRNDRVIGMLTDRDVCIAAYTQGKRLPEMSVASAMAVSIEACRPTDSIADAEQVMRSRRVRRLPVIDQDRRLVGILSLNDIAQATAREHGAARPAITDAELAKTLWTVCKPRHELAVVDG